MNSTFLRLCLGVLLCGAFCGGCRRAGGPPPPLSAEELPAAFAKGFAKAKPALKELSGQVVSALAAKDYPSAYGAVYNLCAAADATKAERELSTRALLTVTALLQAAQSQGDTNATQALQAYKAFK